MTKRRAKAGKSQTKRKPSTGSRAAARSLVGRLKAQGFVVYKRGKKKRHAAAVKAAKTRAEERERESVFRPPEREPGRVLGELVVYEAEEGAAQPALARLDQVKEHPPIWKAELVALHDGEIVAQESVESPFALEDESEGTALRRAWRTWLEGLGRTREETPAVGLVRLAILPPASA